MQKNLLKTCQLISCARSGLFCQFISCARSYSEKKCLTKHMFTFTKHTHTLLKTDIKTIRVFLTSSQLDVFGHPLDFLPRFYYFLLLIEWQADGIDENRDVRGSLQRQTRQVSLSFLHLFSQSPVLSCPRSLLREKKNALKSFRTGNRTQFCSVYMRPICECCYVMIYCYCEIINPCCIIKWHESKLSRFSLVVNKKWIMADSS